jgi:hypothetical protein
MIVNLNKYKKQRERAEAERRAAETKSASDAAKPLASKTSANVDRPKNLSKINASIRASTRMLLPALQGEAKRGRMAK